MQRFTSALGSSLLFAIQSGDPIHCRRASGCASDGPVSGQEIPGIPNTRSLAKNDPDPTIRPPVVRSATLSHGCQSQQLSYLSHRATPHNGYPTRSVTYDPLAQSLEPQQVGAISIPLSWSDTKGATNDSVFLFLYRRIQVGKMSSQSMSPKKDSQHHT